MDEVRAFWERKGLPEEPQQPAHDVLIIHQALRAHEETSPARAAGSTRSCRWSREPSEERSAPTV